MARASTPLDALEPLPSLAVGNSIPVKNQPWLSVGQIVRGVTWTYSRYYLKKLIKASGKNITREILDLLNRGESLEFSIAGIQADYALPTMWVCNQCYLADGQCHSGLSWHYKVLIKGILDGKNVCVIPRVWIREDGFVPLSEVEFQDKAFYKDHRDHIYQCVLRQDGPAFVYRGHIRKDGEPSWDNHMTSRRLTHWQRRSFQLFLRP